jgi:nickel-dependent lactate racemase
MGKKFNIIFVSELEEKIVRSMNFAPAKSKEEALSLCSKYLREPYRWAIMPHAYFTLPQLP